MHAHRSPTILQVLPRLESGGVERGTVEMARAIAGVGWKPLVASAPGRMVNHLRHAGAAHIPMALETKSPLFMAWNARKLERLIREHEVDIVHARSRAPAWSAQWAARRTGAHFITTFHGVYSAHYAWKKKYNAIMTRGERVIAVSDFIAAHIAENYQVEPERVRVIHRGVDLNTFRPSNAHPNRMAEMVRNWHIPDDLPVILFPGRITRWKGQDIFVRALAELPHRRFFALLVGDFERHPDYREEIEQLIRDSRLEGHVRMVGGTEAMVEAYHLARFVVATSTRPEAFGRVVIEAQGMGKPVIATNHGGARETVREGITGWLVEPGGVEGLSKTIDYVLHMDEQAIRWMGAQGIDNAHYFSTEAMCEKTLAVYREVLGANGRLF